MFRAVVQLKAVVQQNRIETRQQNRNALKQKCGVPVVFRHAQNSPTEVGQELAGITVHGAKRLHSNRLEDVLVFKCAAFCDLAGGGQLGNSSLSLLLLSASLYVSKRGAYWDRLCRDVVGWLVDRHARALWPNGASYLRNFFTVG